MKRAEEFLNETNPVVELTMENGHKMEIQLFPECAPITVENFLGLVEQKFYDGIIFHRVIKGFMIQGGDPTGTGMGGSSKKIKGEFRSNGVKNDLIHSKGVISMARTNDPNSASSQIFIMHADSPHLDGAYAAFGIVTKGVEVIDEIAGVRTNAQDKPLEEQKIASVRRIK